MPGLWIAGESGEWICVPAAAGLAAVGADERWRTAGAMVGWKAGDGAR